MTSQLQNREREKEAVHRRYCLIRFLEKAIDLFPLSNDKIEKPLLEVVWLSSC